MYRNNIYRDFIYGNCKLKKLKSFSLSSEQIHRVKLTENIYYSLGIKWPSWRLWRYSLSISRCPKTFNFPNVEVKSFHGNRNLYIYKILRDFICESRTTNSLPWSLLELNQFREENEDSLSLPVYPFRFRQNH